MSTLILHNDRFESQRVTLDQLRALPAPQPLGPRHRPIPHALLVDALREEADRRGYRVTRQQLGLSKNAGTLFGVMDLQLQTAPVTSGFSILMTQLGVEAPKPDHVTALGFRSSTDSTIAPQGRAGANVMVCDNLCLSGDIFAFKHKSTTGLDVIEMVSDGFGRFITHAESFEVQLAALKADALTDADAKVRIYDVFARRLMPARLFDDVNRFYFEPAGDMTDCQPRTSWGVYSACTRAARELTPARRFEATAQLGQAFDLVARAA